METREIDIEEFRIISVEKLLEIRELLEEILQVSNGVRVRVEQGEGEVKPQENHEGKS
jgi:hypothetical protein